MRRDPAIISLNEDEVKTLTGWTRQGKSEHRLVERAKIILLAHQGKTNQQIARQLHTRTARVSKWRQRFGQNRLAGLRDAARSGQPAKYDRTTEKQVLALLDEPPPKGLLPMERESLGRGVTRRQFASGLAHSPPA